METMETDNVSLCIDLQAQLFSARADRITSLWDVLRDNAVEPLQASMRELTSFVDECLFFASILERPKVQCDGDELQGSWSDSGVQEYTSLQPPSDDPIGLVYVHSGPGNIPAREVNVGIVISPEKRRKGYAREAMVLALGWVFDELKFHRAQAAIMDMADKDRALLFFTSIGFSHEGIRRRSIYQSGMDGENGVWKDVTYLAMLDTEWVVRKSLLARGAPSTLWEELFNRHSSEREKLASWEERHGRLQRTASMETIREAPRSKTAEKQKMTVEEAERLFLYTSSDQSSTSSCQSSVHGSAPASPGPDIRISWAKEINEEVTSNSFNHRPFPPPHGPWLSDTRLRDSLAESQHWLRATSSQVELLPSIPSAYPSITGSEYAISIPSPSSPPPDTPSAGSSSPDRDTDSEMLDPGDVLSQINLLLHDSTPRAIVNLPSFSNSTRSGRSSTVSSQDSWCDARSNTDSDWDIVGSNSSDGANSACSGRSPKRRAKRREGLRQVSGI
ncbi:hypothetical protein BKA82DRAFT_4068355 [Pisolithus tinctorius]|nr:hypothetical protein BKA82DRAFT_4068355 [Pisolithus tinctorius]